MTTNNISTESESSKIETISDINKKNEAILIRRAQEIAKPYSNENGKHENIIVLVFLLSGEKYAVEMKYVREVTILRSLTTLPGTPDYILGIISIRGKILSVTDLRVFLNLYRHGISDYNKIIVLEWDKMEIAILADQVEGMQIMDLNNLSETPPTIHGIGKEYLFGVFPGTIIFINAKTVLGDPRLIVRRSEEINLN